MTPDAVPREPSPAPPPTAPDDTTTGGDIAELLRLAAAAAKCAPCGCAHGAVRTVSASSGVADEVRAAAESLGRHLVPERYQCLGCRVCWPADALAELADTGVDVAPACPVDEVEPRAGWPPLPGAYTALRWAAPVAVCTLGDADLADAVVRSAGPETGIVGTLATENLGIERLITNTIANPNLRFVILAGPEPRQRVGHCPGATLLALAKAGTDRAGRIIGAPGRRPILANLADRHVERFRTTVEVVDLIGEHDPVAIAAAALASAERNPGPAEAPDDVDRVIPTAGYLPPRLVPDPAGYFVIYPNGHRGLLALEHYTNDGLLDTVIEGPTPAHCYAAAIDKALLTRLDHAAYLGRELARAHAALHTGQRYTQDAAPEQPGSPDCADTACSCHAAT